MDNSWHTCKKVDGTKHHKAVFEGPATLADMVKTTEPTSAMYMNDSAGAPSDWNGNTTLDQANTLGIFGWDKGRDKLVSKAAVIAQADMGLAPAIRYDVAGNRPHPARAAAGAPDSMIHAQPDDKAQRPVITLAYSPSHSSAVEPKQMENRGAAILTLVDQLEEAGYSVELAMVHASAKGTERLVIYMPIKHAGQPLDINKAGYWMAHPSALRRSIFAVKERVPDRAFIEAYSFSYGTPSDPTDKEWSDLPNLDGKPELYFPCVLGKAPAWMGSPSKAWEHVKKQAKEAGLDILDADD